MRNVRTSLMRGKEEAVVEPMVMKAERCSGCFKQSMLEEELNRRTPLITKTKGINCI